MEKKLIMSTNNNPRKNSENAGRDKLIIIIGSAIASIAAILIKILRGKKK
ncbi:MAG: hypothetical protein HUU45_15630 [Leptospiraceae bacterium]|nr:hypothetical protein [Leptospiraceae bacterium]